MAITWGAYVNNSTGNGMRMGYEFSQSPATVGTGTASVTVTLKLYVQTKAAVSDSSNTQSVSGDFSASGSVDISHGSGGGSTLLRTLTRTVSTSYTATVKSDFSASLTGINAIPGTSSVSGAWTTAKRPLSVPAAPTAATVARTSDTSQTVSWTNTSPSAAGAPYTNLEVHRWDNVSGTYKLIATVGVTTSYVDSTTVANRKYEYRVRAKNSAGASGYAYSQYISTTPSAPGTPAASKTSAGDIVLAWSNTATAGTGVEVWHAANGVWEGTRMTLLTGQPTTWTHVSPDPGVTHAYKLKAQAGTDADDVAPNLYSGFSGTSNTIQLLTNPGAPTGLSPASVVRAPAEDILLTWAHNAVDGTGQTAYEVEHRAAGGSWTSTGKTTGTTSAYTIPGGTYTAAAPIEWRVRTWGLYAVEPSSSVWSTTAVIPTSVRPTASINEPGEVVDGSRLTVVWGYYDAEASVQAEWSAYLYDAEDNTLDVLRGIGAGTTATFGVPLTDGATYKVGVAVRDGAGLWSAEAQQAFLVDYAEPLAPTVIPEWVPDVGAVVVTIDCPPVTVEDVPTEYLQVWRSIDGAAWTLVADQVPPNSAITDYVPGLAAVNYYRATAYSALPSTADSAVATATTESHGHWVWVNAGPGFSQMVRIRDNAKVSVTPSREKVIKRFAGRTRPVEFSGEQRTTTITLAGRLAPDSSTPEEITALADLAGPACFRDPTGRRHFVSVGAPQISAEGVVKEISWSFTEVDYDG